MVSHLIFAGPVPKNRPAISPTSTEIAMENKNTTRLSQSTFEQHYNPFFQYFVNSLKAIYWAEKNIEELLKKNKQLVITEELMDALEDHELQTHKHGLRLEKIFHHLGIEPEAKKCETMAGIHKEVEATISKMPEKSMTRDAVIIIMAQKIEHYEIAVYRSLLQIALTFNLDKIAQLLEKTLVEEEERDVLLSDIAESYINFEAAEESDRDEDEVEEKDEEATEYSPSATTVIL